MIRGHVPKRNKESTPPTPNGSARITPDQEIESLSEDSINGSALHISESEAHARVEDMKRKERDFYEKSIYRNLPKRDRAQEADTLKYFQDLQSESEITLDYPTSRYLFADIWMNMLDHDPYLAREDRWIVENFVKWLIQDETSFFDLRKGICFSGANGCGKTTLMKAGVYFSAKYLDDDRKYHFKPILDIILDIETAKSISAISPYLRGNWAFDDIGQTNDEVVVFSRYGIVEVLINRRTGGRFFTMATTNMDPEDIRERYGDTVASRFNQMFTTAIFLSDQDCRHL